MSVGALASRPLADPLPQLYQGVAVNLVNGYLKAHVAGIAAAVTLVITDLTNGGISTADQWAAIVVAFLAAFGLTAVVPNTATQAPVLTPAPAPVAPVVVAPTAVSPVVVQVPEAPPVATPLAPVVEAPPVSVEPALPTDVS